MLQPSGVSILRLLGVVHLFGLLRKTPTIRNSLVEKRSSARCRKMNFAERLSKPASCDMGATRKESAAWASGFEQDETGEDDRWRSGGCFSSLDDVERLRGTSQGDSQGTCNEKEPRKGNMAT